MTTTEMEKVTVTTMMEMATETGTGMRTVTIMTAMGTTTRTAKATETITMVRQLSHSIYSRLDF